MLSLGPFAVPHAAQPAAADSATQETRRDTARVVSRALFGDVAIEVRIVSGSSIAISVADDARSLALAFRHSDLRRWADSARRIVAYRSSRRAATRTLRVAVDEPGIRGGSLALSRTISAGVSTYTLFAADGDFERVRTTLSDAEARTFIATIRRAVGVERRASRGRVSSLKPRT